MICRKFKKRMMYRLEDPPNWYDGYLDSWRLNLFYILNIEFKESRTIKRDPRSTVQLLNQMLKSWKPHPHTQPKQPAKFHIQQSCFDGCGSAAPWCGSAALNVPLGPEGYKFPNGYRPQNSASQRSYSQKTEPVLLSLSSIAPNSPLKRISTSHHQILREKAANFDWRADLLIPPLKRAFGSRLAGGSRVYYSWSLLLAG
jgi:hypothetical protein